MAKKIKMEEVSNDINLDEIDLDEVNNTEPNYVEVKKEIKIEPKDKISTVKHEPKQLINCLKNERIKIKFIPKPTGIWGNNPKHVLSGGMSDNSSRTFVVPKLSSGVFVNVLTDDEKDFLEQILGLEYNALSIYKKTDNFWDDSNPLGIGTVTLHKQDNYLDLSKPDDYIRYKILLANKNYIAASLKELEEKPKVTYQYVIIKENEEVDKAKSAMSITMQCYKEYGKIEEDEETLRVLIEIIEGKPVAPTAKLAFLQTKINELIQKDNKKFLTNITDKYLQTKVLIKKAIAAGIVVNRGNYLYLRDGNTPLCEQNEEPTLVFAAKFINHPKHQDIKFSIEAKLNQ